MITWTEHILALYAIFIILIKLFFYDKIKNAEFPDIISGGLDCVIDEKQKIRKKWYYKIRKWI